MNGISIIIPISGRTRFLTKLIDSFYSAENSNVNVELLIVDNSPKISDSILIEKLAKSNKVSYLKSERGVVKARNYGARQAKYDYLVFVDSDCIFDKNTLLEYGRLVNESSVDCAAGRTMFEGESSLWFKLLKDSYFLLPFKWCEWDKNILWSPMSNFLIKKEIFMKVNCFHSILPPNEASEDVDLGIRINSFGYSITGCPQCVVYHTTETWNSLTAIIKRFFRFGRGESKLIIKHNRFNWGFPGVSFLFLSLLLFSFLFSIFKQVEVAKIIMLSILINLLFSLIIHRILRVSNSLSFVQFIFLKFIEFLYDSGKLFQSLIDREFTAFKYFPFTQNAYINQWHQNRINLITYLFTIFTVLRILCLK